MTTSLRGPACPYYSTTNVATRIWSGCFRRFLPTFRNSCPGLHSYNCPETWSSGWKSFLACWPLITLSSVPMWVTKYFLMTFRSYFPELKPSTGIWSDQSWIVALCAFASRSKCCVMYSCLTHSLETSPPFCSTSQNRLSSSFGSLSEMCSGSRSYMLARETETGTS